VAVKTLSTIVRTGRRIRVIGFDDGPPEPSGAVPVAGVVCGGTRFEGMLWGRITPDGFDATRVLTELLSASKFLPQVHLVLLDGVAFGGLNVVDLPALASALERPVASVMRRLPDLPAVRGVARRLPDPERRLALLQRAGPIHQQEGFVFQVHGAEPAALATALGRLTDTGRVPEALRLAHLITAAVATGQSGRRA